MFSDPVVGDNFFGRSGPLALLAKRVNGLKDGYRQNIAIVGPKLIGKSSLILEFVSTIKHSKIIPIYVDLQPNSFNNFAFKFLGALLYHYLKSKKISLIDLPSQGVNEELQILKKHSEKSIPQTVQLIQGIENNIKNLQLDQAYEALLNLTAVLKKECGLPCMLILDDFHLLTTYKIKRPFSSLAREIMMQKDTMYIFISSHVSDAKRILANDLSLLFGNFEAIDLKPFDYPTCCQFLENRFQGLRLPKNLRDFLISFSEGHPFYLNILSNKLRAKAKEFNKIEIGRSLISQAFVSLTYDSQGILNQYFTNLINRNLNGTDFSNLLPILLIASERGYSLSDMSKMINRLPKIISKQINYLLEKDLLIKLGTFYRIQDKIFRFWLKSVYRRKSLFLTADPARESREFSREIENQITTFSQEAKQMLAERVIDLFKAFRNEIIMLQSKSFKFWQFEEVRLWKLPDCIIARYQGGYWACLVKKERVTEEQIQEFFHCCKNSRLKVRKIIIITFEELDLNVRLTALEAKVWIWHLEDLNTLLDLYGKEQVLN